MDLRMTGLSRRALLGATGAAAIAASVPGRASATEKVSFITTWFAQAEHGGFYQAQASGLYVQAGLDVDVRMGGPQVNNTQLLLAGEVDMIAGYDIQILNAIQQGLPVVTVGTSFQYDLQGLMTHSDVTGLDGLAGKTILVAGSGQTTWWPWLRDRYGLDDAQVRPYTFNLQPFFVDPNTVQQAYPSSEPFQAEQRGVPVNFFLFADAGYPPYGTTMVTTRKMLETRPEVVRAFVRASVQGWKDYLGDPGPANALIKAANSKMTDAQIAFGVRRMKELGVLDAKGQTRVGAMTEARWQATYDYLTKAGLLDPKTEWKRAFTTEFVDDLDVRL